MDSISFSFFSPYNFEIRWMNKKKTTPPPPPPQKKKKKKKHKRTLPLMPRQALSIIWKSSVNSNWSYSPEMLNLSKIWHFFVLWNLEIWRMTLKKIGHLFCATSSFVHHVVAIGQFKLVRKRSIRVKIDHFCSMWPWNLTDDPEIQFGTSSMLLQVLCIISQPSVNSNSSYSPENAQFGSKSANFGPVWHWNLFHDLEKQYGTPSMLHQALCIISQPSVDSNSSYSPETSNSGQNRQLFVPCNLEI